MHDTRKFQRREAGELYVHDSWRVSRISMRRGGGIRIEGLASNEGMTLLRGEMLIVYLDKRMPYINQHGGTGWWRQTR